MSDIDRIIRLVTDWKMTNKVEYVGANNVLDLLVELREARQKLTLLARFTEDAYSVALDLGLEDLRRKIEKVMNR